MKKTALIALMLLLIGVLCSCRIPLPEDIFPEKSPTPTQSPTPYPTYAERPSPTPTPLGAELTPTPEVTPGPFDPKVNRERYPNKDILEYFYEIALYTEYGTHGKQEPIQKWTAPLKCFITGYPNEEDMQMVLRVFESLNNLPGFPGIKQVDTEADSNVYITFLPEEEYFDFSRKYIASRTYGFAAINRDETNRVIHSATIGFRTDLTQSKRNAVIIEELTQMLGLLNDTYRHPESIFYQGPHEPQWYTDLDWILVQLLYHPLIKPGMTYEECATILPLLLCD